MTEIFLDFYIRTDFSLYFAAHTLLGNHAATLRTLSLKFCAKHYTVLPESISGQQLSLSLSHLRRMEELITTFGKMKLESLHIDFLPYEGTSLFYLSKPHYFESPSIHDSVLPICLSSLIRFCTGKVTKQLKMHKIPKGIHMLSARTLALVRCAFAKSCNTARSQHSSSVPFGLQFDSEVHSFKIL